MSPEKAANHSQQRSVIANWGKDHWSTLLYLEARIVDYGRKIDDRNMRTWDLSSDKNYPTVLKDGTELDRHDDWECLHDLIEAGFAMSLEDGETYDLTNWGWQTAGELRRWKAERKLLKEFTAPDRPAALSMQVSVNRPAFSIGTRVSVRSKRFSIDMVGTIQSIVGGTVITFKDENISNSRPDYVYMVVLENGELEFAGEKHLTLALVA